MRGAARSQGKFRRRKNHVDFIIDGPIRRWPFVVLCYNHVVLVLCLRCPCCAVSFGFVLVCARSSTGRNIFWLVLSPRLCSQAPSSVVPPSHPEERGEELPGVAYSLSRLQAASYGAPAETRRISTNTVVGDGRCAKRQRGLRQLHDPSCRSPGRVQGAPAWQACFRA